MAANRIQIKFDIDNKDLDILAGKTLTLQQQIRILKQEIQKPGYAPAELDLLRKKLGDTEDALKATRARSGDLITTLQLVPGPIGDIAAKLNGAISLFKQFGSFNLADLKFQLKETIDDVKEVGASILRATGLSKLWTAATTGLSRAFVGLGVAQSTAAVAARALAAAIAATGIGLLVVGLSMAISKLMEYTSNTKEAEAANEKFTDSIRRASQALDDEIEQIKDNGEIRLLEAKKAGKSESELQKIKLDNVREEIKALEQSLTDKGRFAKIDLELVKNTALSEEEIRKKSAENAENRNKASRALVSARITLQKLELQGQIEANERAKQAANEATQRSQKTIKELQDAAEVRRRNTQQQLKDIKSIGLAAIQSIKEQQAAEDARKKSREDFNKKIRDLGIALIDDEKERRIAEIRAQQQDELEAFQRDENFIKKSEEEKGQIRLAIRMKYDKLVNGVRKEATKEQEKQDEEDAMRELRILELRGQGLVKGTKAYFQNRLEILNKTQELETEALEKAYKKDEISKEEYEAKKTAIERKGVQARKALKQEELQAVGQTISASIDALGSLANALAGSLEEEAKTSKEAFEKRKKLQIATAVMSAASGLVQILTQPSTLPSPFDWITKGINAAALAIATTTNIKKIRDTEFEGGGQAAGTGVVAMRAQGGIVTGPGTSTSDSIPAMISNGEFVVNARATSAFLPMLNAINDYGRRPRFAMGGLVQPQSPQNIFTENLNRAIETSMTRPVRTYVVGQEMSNQQQLDRVIKSRSLM